MKTAEDLKRERLHAEASELMAIADRARDFVHDVMLVAVQEKRDSQFEDCKAMMARINAALKRIEGS